MKFYRQLVVLIFLLPSALYAQTDSTDIIIKKLMDQQKITGLSIAIVKEGKPVFNKGFGLANAEHQVAANSETVFRLGSISKQFFTAAIMKLQEDGKLTIDDYVHTFFPDAPEIWRPIQIKHLMSHSSGIKRESPAYDNFKMKTDLEIIKAAYPLAMDFKTGEKYQYCNVGYYMLAQIITQVSGKPWGKYIHEKLFVPAGMMNTYLTEFETIIPNRASGYYYKNDTLMNATSMFAIRPSGGFLSTTTDMIKWDNIITDKKLILKKESWEKLWKPFIKTSTKPESKSYYGFGWGIDEVSGHQIISHGGANMGFRTHYSRFINDGLSIIILTNEDEAVPAVIVNTLAAYYLRK
ncbi:MAG: serine hydrolase domain-containing protein [Chitinophagaceae bacterium]